MNLDDLRRQRPSVAPKPTGPRVRTNGKTGSTLVPVTGKAAPKPEPKPEPKPKAPAKPKRQSKPKAAKPKAAPAKKAPPAE